MNKVLKNIIKKSEEDINSSFNEHMREKIISTISTNKEKISSNIFIPKKVVTESINKATKKILQSVITKWQSLGPTKKNLDKAIDFVSKTEKFDKVNIKKRILDGNVNEAVWLINGEITDKSNLDILSLIISENKEYNFKYQNQELDISPEDSYDILNMIEGLDKSTKNKISDIINKDVESFKKIIKYSKDKEY